MRSAMRIQQRTLLECTSLVNASNTWKTNLLCVMDLSQTLAFHTPTAQVQTMCRTGQISAVKNTRIWMLFVIGVVGMVGTVCNIITISTFTYLYCFANRIKRQFNQEFTMTSDPVFFLILHLSLCDLLYCVIGLPSYWSVYFYGYYRYSEMMCKYFGFFRKCLGISYKINSSILPSSAQTG